MKFSVAMCTYNGEKFLSEQIESILNQTEEIAELVICDDGSTDGTPELIKKYEEKDRRVKVIFNPSNLGYVKNFEKSLSATTGDWIFLSDQDDVWLPGKVERYASAIRNSDDSLGMIFGNAQLIDDHGKGLNVDLFSLIIKDKGLIKASEKKPDRFFSLLKGNFITGATVAINRQVLKKLCPFPRELVHDHWLGIACLAFGHGIHYEHESQTLYRKHGGQAVGVSVVAMPEAGSCERKVDDNLLKQRRALLHSLQEKKLYWDNRGKKFERRLKKEISAHYALKLHKMIMATKRADRIKYIIKYLISKRYDKWVKGRPRFLFALIHALYDSIR